MLPYLCDVAVDLGRSPNGRDIEIIKARNQNFQSGKHPFRISDGAGLIVYPSLSAVLSTLRHKVKATISEEKYIPLPKNISAKIELKKIIEKTLTLIEGPAVGGKTVLLLDIITSDTEYMPKDISQEDDVQPQSVTPNNILIITFRTSENLYNQKIRTLGHISKKWLAIPDNTIRWFSPGLNLTAEQIVSTIWRLIRTSKRSNNPFDRIVFDDIESASNLIPDISQKKLFWPTIMEFVTSEAITAFFVADTDSGKYRNIDELRSGMDYIFDISFSKSPSNINSNNMRRFTLKKWIDHHTFQIHGERNSIDFDL